MKPKIHEIHMANFDFASLYPSTMKIKIDKTKFRRKKIELLIEKINDKRTDQELPTE